MAARGWCSLWNGSQVAELDLRSGRVVRQIALMPPKTAIDASSHPTALLLSPDERSLYVTLSNRDAVAVISTADGQVERYLDTRLPGQTYGGSYPNALAQSQDGSKLFRGECVVGCSRGVRSEKPEENWCCVFHSDRVVSHRAGGARRRAVDRDRQGQGTGPNAGWEDDPRASRQAAAPLHPLLNSRLGCARKSARCRARRRRS